MSQEPPKPESPAAAQWRRRCERLRAARHAADPPRDHENSAVLHDASEDGQPADDGFADSREVAP